MKTILDSKFQYEPWHPSELTILMWIIHIPYYETGLNYDLSFPNITDKRPLGSRNQIFGKQILSMSNDEFKILSISII